MLSFIIPAYVVNERLAELTEHCLASIQDADQIILVDNGSTFDTRLPFTHRIKDNAGYTKAVNLGLAVSDGDIICVGNNDLAMFKDWRPRLESLLETNDIAHFRLSNDMQGGLGMEYGLQFSSFWAMTRDAFEKLGLLDNKFWGAYGDTDYWTRAKHLDLKIVKDNDYTIDHEDGATFKTTGRKDDGSEAYYVQKWSNT